MNSYLSRYYRAGEYLAALFCYKQRLAGILSVGLDQVDKFYREINESGFIELIAKRSSIEKRSFPGLGPLSFFRGQLLYVLCRLAKPEIVVETGVERGFSASFILYALSKNGNGSLYSIDLPNQPGQELEQGKATGWVVPEALRAHWQLILGPAQIKLPKLLAELGKVDIFFHDSDHSYANMAFELGQAAGYVPPGGILAVDDISENKAFFDFSRTRNLKHTRIFKMGLIKIEG